jgi:antitoxin component of MazEF toxin-antitoxin module
MPPIHLKVARIGNSRGVRLPAVTLERYRIGDRVIMEEREEGILLRPTRVVSSKLSWEDTARAMALEIEDWSDWDETLADGLEQIAWDLPEAKHVAERTPVYSAGTKQPKQRTRQRK